MLINTARGALIDTRAAIDALKTRDHLSYLRIDVYDEEGPLFGRDPDVELHPQGRRSEKRTMSNRPSRPVRYGWRRAVLVIAAAAFAAWGSVAHAADPIKIGFSIPLTGGLASNGRAILTTYQMWEEDINVKGGLLGRPVKLIYFDDQSNPALVPGIYAKLLDIDNVDLVISSYGTNMTMPVMPVVIPRKRVLLSLFALAVNERFNYPNYFSMLPVGPSGVREISRGFFEIAREQEPKLQTVAIVGADTDFAAVAADGARANAVAMGFKIVYHRGYPPNTVDFTPIIRAIAATKPDIVYVASYPSDSVGIVRAANEQRLRTKLFGGAWSACNTRR